MQDKSSAQMKASSSLLEEDQKWSLSRPSETRRYSGHREAISSKYAAIREQSRKPSNMKPVEDLSSAKVSLLDPGNSNITGVTSGVAAKWETMKSGLLSFKTKIGAKKFLPLHQVEDSKLIHRVSSSESLEDIFERLKRPESEQGGRTEEDDKEMDI